MAEKKGSSHRFRRQNKFKFPIRPQVLGREGEGVVGQDLPCSVSHVGTWQLHQVSTSQTRPKLFSCCPSTTSMEGRTQSGSVVTAQSS